MANEQSELAGYTLKYWQRDLPSSLVVFLVALPLCMGVAIASGAPVSAGLITGIVGGIIVGLLSGAPLQVSGPAAGLTVLVLTLIQTFGIERLGVCVLAAGALQLLAGYFKLGQWFRAVSPAVIQGMLAGIGVLIFAGQFHVMVDDKPRHTGLENLLTIPEAIWKSFPPPALGDAEEREQETRDLQHLGKVHLLQTELMDEVHHLVSAVTLAAPVDKHHRSQPPPAADIEFDPATEASLKESLQSLAARQTEVLEKLAELKSSKSSDQHQAARDAVQAALDDLSAGDFLAARASQDKAEAAVGDLLRSRKNHGFAALLGLLTIGCIVGWKSLAIGRLKLVPAPLVAVVVATLAAAFIMLPVLYVEVPDNLASEIAFPTWAEFKSLLDPNIWLMILQLAVIASAETLLCASAVDQLHNGPRTQYDRELKAQGIGNMICGLLCALPMTGVIVRSSANLQAGAKTRWSSVFHGTWILIFVALCAGLLRYIPQSSLAAILVYTGYKLVNIKSAKALAKRGQSEVAIYVATVVTIVATHLLTGVIVGLVLSLLKLLYVFTQLEIERTHEPGTNVYTIRLRGSATFLKLPVLAAHLEQIPADAELHVNVENLDYIDAACLDLLDDWASQNESQGAKLLIDAESLHARFWRRRAPDPLPPLETALPSTNGGRVGATTPRQKQRPI